MKQSDKTYAYILIPTTHSCQLLFCYTKSVPSQQNQTQPPLQD